MTEKWSGQAMMEERDPGRGRAITGCSELACAAAAMEVLDTMFFEVPLDKPEMVGQAPEQPVAATVAFDGDLSGWLSVAPDRWAARRLAADFLGREDGSTVTGAEIRQVSCELANMICGNMLSRIEPRGRYRIARSEAAPAREVDLGWLTFRLESGALAVCLKVEGR